MLSHPSWVRGLKYINGTDRTAIISGSHPSWVRGLKYDENQGNNSYFNSRTPRGCVD